eukprot:TRINITY_DN15466_c0_g1_i9.p1 TRINITY_DN15466_c0_g1~~TRINITY_DN15466_c0_g1_i9.p1  ORF type:complete len:324 (-),score=39.63 TRINITY_DN15466_c0_g1_i9:778-1749(-)
MVYLGSLQNGELHSGIIFCEFNKFLSSTPFIHFVFLEFLLFAVSFNVRGLPNIIESFCCQQKCLMQSSNITYILYTQQYLICKNNSIICKQTLGEEMLGLNDKSVGDIGPQEILKYIEQQKFEDNQSPELQDLLRKVKGESDENCEEVSPTPGDENGRKVFVNICGNDRVAAPGGWEDGKIPEDVQKALSVSSEELSQAQQELLRFPLSLGERYHDLDNKGVPCIVYDVIFHADIIQQCSAVRKLKIFVVELSLGWIQHKQQCKLDPKYKLPKMKYKGDIIRTQRIRVDKKKFITDLGDVLEEPEFPLLTKTAPPAKKITKNY